MKIIGIVLFVLIAAPCVGQIGKAEVTDPRLLKIVDITIDSLAIPGKERGVITLEITNFNVVETEIEVKDERYGTALKKIETLNYDVKTSFNMNEVYLKYHPPSFYFYYRDRPVLVYSGAERFVNVDPKQIDKLRRELKNHFPSDRGSFTPPLCWMKVNGDDIVVLRKWTVDW
jgi:hypothetical protein